MFEEFNESVRDIDVMNGRIIASFSQNQTIKASVSQGSYTINARGPTHLQIIIVNSKSAILNSSVDGCVCHSYSGQL